MDRRVFLSGLGGAVVAAALGGRPFRGTVGRSAKPNIIYILADDLGYGHLGCFGQTEIKTPNIDRMAAEGMKFTNHYAGSAVCAPSRCVLMTGLHTGHCYVRGNRPLPVEGNVPIPANSQTIPKLLKKAGYATAAIGKWGLGYPGSEGDPIKQGFDHFFGYNCQRQAHSYYPAHLWRNDKKVILKGNLGGKQQEYSHDLLTAEALEWIQKSNRKPFYLYLPYTIPHAKFQVPDLGIYADKPWSKTKKAIAAMITRLDGDVGRILRLVKELGIEKNTLVVFTSDNGSAGGALANEFNGSGTLRGTKGSMYEGGLRVPFVARWPGKIKAGTVSNHVCSFQDMMATFAEMAGVDIPGPTDGISILPTLLGKDEQNKHDYLYWELGGKSAVRMGKWKAVVGKKGDFELFDLSKDLGEENDIAAQHPELVKKIKVLMKASHTETPWTTWKYDGPIGKRRN
jgi:arylsulfatase A